MLSGDKIVNFARTPFKKIVFTRKLVSYTVAIVHLYGWIME